VEAPMKNIDWEMAEHWRDLMTGIWKEEIIMKTDVRFPGALLLPIPGSEIRKEDSVFLRVDSWIHP